MNEVEKMYKTIFGEFASNCSLCTKLIDCEIFNNTHNCNKFECDYKRLFTAEKQLELIKWLALRDTFDMMAWQNGECHIEHDKYNANENSLENCLARLFNNLWQDLTEEERKQIKEILE